MGHKPKDGKRHLNPYIKIWAFSMAPLEYQKLSQNGGDEDYIAFVPEGLGFDPIFLDEGTAFGCCGVDIHKVNGGHIYIGCHA